MTTDAAPDTPSRPAVSKNGSDPTGFATTDFELMAESIPHIVWTAAPDGSTDYFNRQGTAYTGRAAEANYGWDWLGLVHPDDAARARVAWDEATRSASPYRLDYRLRRADGEYRWHAFRACPIVDDGGAVGKWIGTATDIEDAKQSEIDLQLANRAMDETLKLLETLLSKAPVGFGFIDRDCRMVRMNETLAAVSGSSVSEHLGRTVAEIVPDLWPQVEPLFRRVFDDGVSVLDVEVEGPVVDGSPPRHWLASYYPVSLFGDIIGIGIIVVDITERHAARRVLEASEYRLGVAQQIAHLGSFEWDRATLTSTWSREQYRILGLDESTKATDDLYFSLVHPDDRAIVRDAWTSCITTAEPADLVYRIIRPDGEQRWVRSRVVPELDADGRVEKVAGTLLDDTERVQAEAVRRAAETRFEIGFEQAAIGAAISDLHGVPIRVNPALCALLDRPASSLVGRTWVAYNHPDEIPLREAALARVADGHDSYEDERRFVRPDGTIVWASSHVTLVRDARGEAQYFFVQLQNITDRKQIEEEFAHQALHDSLTGLPNRTLLTDRLAHSLAGSRRRRTQLAVMFCDVDNFKQVNDSLGHGCGDDLLREVADRIAASLRPGDTVARFGGDEFVIVCDDVSVHETSLIAERVLDALSQPCMVGTHEINVTSSIGVVIADTDATPETLLRDSDFAMYRAKDHGRGRIELFDEALRSKTEHRLATAAALHHAIEREEFTVYYQPIVDLSTGLMVSAEALVRWEHPDGILVNPDVFIPLAEQTGLIVPIGAWVLEQACSQLVGWQRTHPAMSVAVNLSVRQMVAPDIDTMIRDILERTGAPPDRLCLELTESVFMEDVDYFAAMLGRLKDLGLHLAIDDFGTGYSSLSYLKRFPLDAVKVDRTFVEGLGNDPYDTALVTAIVAMATALELEVTAEGVETREQLLHLKGLHCPRAQGFHLARPMPAPAMNRLMANPRRWPVD